MTAATAHVTGLSLLVEWANEQDHWIRQIVGEVIEIRRRLSDARIEALYQMLLHEKELAAGDPVSVAALSAAALTVPAQAAVRLESLKHIENVNALAADQEIEFHPRLSICFGENASGKTGYVRIFKCAASVRTADPILPNVRGAASSGPPRATIKVLVGDQARVIEWQGEQGVEPLTRVDVFDARAAVVHLADDLTYSYTPAELSLFPLVADAIERVRTKLQTARDERQPRTNPFVNRFARESRIYAKIEGLGASTNLQDLETLANISPEEEAALPGLREKVGALRAGSVRAQIEQADRGRTVLERVLDMAGILESFDRNAHGEALAELRKAQATRERATREALADEDIPGVLGEAWKDFVAAAEGYIKEVNLDPYPAPGQACIYCRQPLSDSATTLLRKYREYCNDSLQKAVERARDRANSLSAAVRGLRLDEVEKGIKGLIAGLDQSTAPPPPLIAARSVLEHARAVQQAIEADADCPPSSADLEGVPATLSSAVQTAKATVADLRKQGVEREQALAREQERLREVEARLTLRELLPQIREHVDAASWGDRATSYLRPFQGMKRSLTEASKKASAEVMNRDFEQRFEAECQALRAPSIALDFPGRDGEARRRKLLTRDHGLDQILSEGEQKVVAFADFLAEMSLKPDRSPIVLDDPVTSLDHKRLRHVVDRLVHLSRERQVIVFTHDIWFAAELLGRFEHEPRECALNDVTAEGQRIGLVARGLHPKTDTFNDRKRRILSVLQEADQETGETRHALIEKGYEVLRGTCEIVVEKDLLRGVTERYRPNVRMTVLNQISAERLPAAVQAIVPIFEKCCRLIASHSQPLATQGVRPTLDELRADWNTVQEARKEYLAQ